MSEISKRPWAVNEVHGVSDRIEDANSRIILAFSEWGMNDVYHIVKAVNEHDSLIAKVEQLKSTISLLQYGKYGTGHYASIAADERQRAEKAEAEVVRLIKLILASGQCIIDTPCPSANCEMCIREYLKESGCDEG